MTQDDCIFCKIIQGDIPSSKVYEDEHVYAFLDISQTTKGHTLVIPKIHTRDIYDTSDEIAQALFKRIPKIARGIQKTYDADGMNILNNNEAAANQSVFHLHLHLIPRYEGDTNNFNFTWKNNDDAYTPEELEKIANSIRKHI